MIQTALVIILFIAASIYVGRMIYRSFFYKKDSCPNCSISKPTKLKEQEFSKNH